MGEKDKLQVHPYKPVSWSPTHQGNPLACRDELVVYLSFSPIYIYIYIYNYQYNDSL